MRAVLGMVAATLLLLGMAACSEGPSDNLYHQWYHNDLYRGGPDGGH